MKLSLQLLAAPLLTAAVAVAAVVALTWDARAGMQDMREVAAARAEATRTLGDAREQLVGIRAGVFRTLAMMSSLDEAAVKAFRGEMARQAEGVGRLLSTATESVPDGERAHRDAVMRLLAQYQRQSDKALDLGTMDPNVGIGAMKAPEHTYAELQKELAVLNRAVDEVVAQRETQTTQDHERTMAVFALVLLVSAGGAMAWSWRAQRRIVGEIARAVALAERVAEGDLAADARTDRRDEIGDLMRSLDGMAQRLRHAMSTVHEATQNIGHASREIAVGNVDLSQRTEEAASNLQQTASSIQQLGGTAAQTAESAHTANQLAASASSVAQRGGDVVARVVATMGEINAASRRIADIIATIDGIAFQTNILALNAAVEAARAGEQGRGFAVVAGEVRNLAQRSAGAAREIKALIGSSVEKVDTGTALVADAGRTMDEIVQSVQRVSDVIAEISAAAAEQSQGIGNVNQAVGQLDSMTQSNAALVEQSAAAAESLNTQAARLVDVVARFRIGSAAAA